MLQFLKPDFSFHETAKKPKLTNYKFSQAHKVLESTDSFLAMIVLSLRTVERQWGEMENKIMSPTINLSVNASLIYVCSALIHTIFDSFKIVWNAQALLIYRWLED